MFEAWTIREEVVAQQDEALRMSVRLLTDTKRAEYYRIFRSKYKDPDTYSVLNWICLTGLHHYYLGKYVRGTFNLVLLFVAVGLVLGEPLAGISLIMFIFLSEIPALFRGQIIVANHNISTGNSIKAKL